METFVQDQQQLRQMIFEMETALEQPSLPAGTLESWKATYQEIQLRSEDVPDAPGGAEAVNSQHLHNRARDLLTRLTQAR